MNGADLDRSWSEPPRPARRVPDVLQEAHQTANWQRTSTLYGQCVDVMASHPSRRAFDELLGKLAEAVFEIWPTYAGQEERLAEHVLAVLAEVEHHEIFDAKLFLRYYTDERFSRPSAEEDRRRRPPLYEAIVETCRRLRDAYLVRSLFNGLSTSGMLCGSTSYGGFFNVRGGDGGHPSDLDFIIAISDTHQLEMVAARLAQLPDVAPAEIDRFLRRALLFGRRYNDDQTIFSHKVTLWTRDAADPMLPAGAPSSQYQISLHFLTQPVLSHVLVSGSTQLSGEVAGHTRTVQDYRDATTDRDDHVLDFAGRRYPRPSTVESVEAGVLRRGPVYFIDERHDSYCPGFIQTQLMFPRETRWDELNVRAELDGFKRKLRDRLRIERARQPNAMLLASFTHIRRDAFAPHIVQLLDAEYRTTD